jgi:hypothetical protein
MSTHRQIVIHMLFVSSPLDCYTHAICQLTTRLLYTCYLSAQHHIVMHMLFISSPSDCYAHAIYHDQLIVRLIYTCYLSAYRQIVTCMLLVSSPSDCYAHVIYFHAIKLFRRRTSKPIKRRVPIRQHTDNNSCRSLDDLSDHGSERNSEVDNGSIADK